MSAVVSNSSPLIALAVIGQLSLLQALFESVLIPPAVEHEIRRSIWVPPAWLRVQALQDALPEAVLRRSLGGGEREAIALAVEVHADPIILDDLPARRVAQAAGLNVIGSVGVLLAAKRRDLLGRIRPALDELRKNSFFLSQQLYDELLRAAGDVDK